MLRRLLLAMVGLMLVSAACGSDPVEVTSELGSASMAGDGTDAGATDGGMDAEHDAGDDPMADESMGDETRGDDDDAAAVGALLLFAESSSSASTDQSARFEGTFRVTGAVPDDPEATVEMTMSGGYDLPAGAMEMTIDMGDLFTSGLASGDAEIPPGFDSFFTEPIQLITIGDQGWLKWSLLSLLTGADGAWMALENDELTSTTEGFGFSGGSMSPTSILESLADADVQLDDLGTETVRGQETRHWRALVDVAALAAEADPAERAALAEQFGDLDSTAYPMDLWVGVGDGLLYRYELSVSEALLLDEEAGAGSGTASLVFEFYDHGRPLGITPPPADQVIDGGYLFGADT